MKKLLFIISILSLTGCSFLKNTACPIAKNDICPAAIAVLNTGATIDIVPVAGSQQAFATASTITTFACNWLSTTGCPSIDTPIANGQAVAIKQMPAAYGASSKSIIVLHKAIK